MTFYFQRMWYGYFVSGWTAVEAEDVIGAHDKLADRTEGIVVETLWFPHIIHKDGKHGWGWIRSATPEELPMGDEVPWDRVRPPAPIGSLRL